ncbi:helix-turn-helix domain-containing protein [Terriglobus tenax]|uniref:helix-turn-helix domain-containing protein n=1 Tax=Terriglobus tenax TaxID=1111115 RepID=UPI0021DFA2FB|nr:helix-turn-helix domain-containing protein [Terriglobus tenax]
MAATLTPPLPQETAENGDALEAHVQRILGSPQFARAETQRRLLEYLWQHRHENLNEYALATEGLGRSHSFDSTVDASVRVHISRLRRKLKDYYQETGEPEMLVIPTRTHQLLVVDPHRAEHSEAVESPVEPLVDYRRLLWIMCAVAAVFAVSTVWLLIARKGAEANAPQPTAFWANFLQGNAPVQIILPTPTFFQFSNSPSLRLRSTSVNSFEAMKTDPVFAAMTKDLGTPRLEQSYTVTWDTLAAIDMARYLDTIGNNKQRISFQVTRDSSMLMLEQANVIALGTHQTLEPLNQYLKAMNFTLSLEEAEVVNAHPAAGEPARFDAVEQSTERAVRPSIIALLPGRKPGLKVLILQSRDTAALVSMLSSSAGSNSIQEMLRKNGNPPYYEMVVQTEMANNRAVRSWPVAVHAFRSGAPNSTM